MKIILSPSKTQTIRGPENMKNPLWQEVLSRLSLDQEKVGLLEEQDMITHMLVDKLQHTEASVIKKKMKLKESLFEKVLDDYRNFYNQPVKSGPAVLCYTGTVFKELHVEDYDEASIEYVHEHLMVLSALYGPLPAVRSIQSYRLDMTMALFDTSLYQTWKPIYEKWFKDEDIIVDLASKEFSKQIDREMITVEFLVWQKEAYKPVAFHSKQARGLMANFMIENRISNPEEMKTFNCLGYTFDKELSSEQHYVFKKKNEK